MILHLLTDDKFSEYVVKQFSSPEMHSEFVIVSETSHLRYLSNPANLAVVQPNTDEFIQLVRQIARYRAIILHGLFWPWDEYVLRNSPSCVKVAWMFWGGEIYGRRDVKASFLAPKTERILRWKSFKSIIRRGLRRKYQYEIPIDLFQRIDYCLTDIPDEYTFATRYLHHEMDFIWYNYYSIEDTLGDTIDGRVNGSNILLGHSGDLEGNHLDVLKFISRGDLGTRKLIVPLSYGDPWVINRITKEGKECFQDSFYPLLTFLPRNEYNQIVSSCSVVIMNHYRPQALGNIITALWMGARVYMSEKSMQYRYFKNQGIILFSIEKAIKDREFSLEALPDEAVSINKRLLLSVYGKEAMYQKILNLVLILNQ